MYGRDKGGVGVGSVKVLQTSNKGLSEIFTRLVAHPGTGLKIVTISLL